jgi:hypothetical protein
LVSGSAGTGTGDASGGGAGGIRLNVGGEFSVGGAFNGKPEVCDGVDNNGNGIVDDVDANSDGVCDCLNIATIGRSGLWGTGNLVLPW